MDFGELLTLRKMITPTVVQVLYILGLILNALSAVVFLITKTVYGHFVGFIVGCIGGVIILAVGTLLVRIYAELIILLFRIYDELVAIRTGRPPAGDVGFPVSPVPGVVPPSPIPAPVPVI